MSNSDQTVVIHNGKIISNLPDQTEPFTGSIVIESGKITQIGEPDTLSPDTLNSGTLSNARVIDATDCWVTPSFIDLCHYIREPGFEHKGTIESETKAAAAAGFTHLVCPPTTSPVIDNPAVAGLIQNLADTSGYCTIYPLGAMTQGLQNQQLSEMHALKEAGCIGIYPGDYLTTDNRTLIRCLEYAGTFNLPLYFRPSDASLSAEGLMHEGEISHRLGIPGIPACAETIAIAQYLQIIAITGVTAHFSRITCAESVQLIADAKAKGLNVSTDVSLQHLLYTDSALENFNAHFLDHPPFRSEPHRQALIKGLVDGTIDAICSNHQPHEPSAKMAPLGDCEKGLSTLDTFIPNLLVLAHQSSIPLSLLIQKITINPAQLLKKQIDTRRPQLPSGTIETGINANIVTINPALERKNEAQHLYPYSNTNHQSGQRTQGGSIATIANGKLTFHLSL